MFLIFAVIFGGILSGCLFRGRCLGFVQPAITAIIWLLLFLLGVEVRSVPEVVGGLATLGVAALAVFACSVVGSIAASWLLWRRIRRHRSAGTAKPQEEDDGDGGPAGESSGQSMWTALKGSLVLVAFFVAGSLVGLFTPLAMIAYNVLKTLSDGRVVVRLEVVKRGLMTGVLAVTIPHSVMAIVWGMVAMAAI